MATQAQKQHTTQPSTHHNQQEPLAQPTERDAAQVIQRAVLRSDSLTPPDVKMLQRTIGNRSTVHLLQPLIQRQAHVPAQDEREDDLAPESGQDMQAQSQDTPGKQSLSHRLTQGTANVQRASHAAPQRNRGFVKTDLPPIQIRRQQTESNADPVIQRDLMRGQQLLRQTDPTSVPIQQIAALVTQYNNTKGLFVRVTPQIANQRFGLLRQIDQAVYAWFNTVSQNHEHLDENPHTPVMKRLLKQTDKEHIDLINKTKDNQNVTPFSTTGMNQQEAADAQALWQSIAGGQGKIKMVGNRSHNKKMLSDLAKIMSSTVGRNMLKYLNSETPAETQNGGVQDPLTNIFIGQNVNQLPGTVTGQLPQQLQETGVSQSQPLIANQAMLQGGAPIPIGGAPGNFQAVGHRRNFRQAVRSNKRGVTHGGQQYAFGQGTGAFVRVVDHDGGLGEATGVQGVDHEVLMPRFVTLAHELGHSANQRAGAGTAGGMNYDALFALAGGSEEEAKNRWDDPEEFLNILNIENAVRSDTGLEARTSHRPVDAVKKTRRWLDIKNQIIAQFTLDNHPDSFGALNAKSKGIWFTDPGIQFAEELVRVRNEIHDDTKWNPLQPLLNQLLHMNEATEKGDYLDDIYDEAMQLVNAKGGRDTLKVQQQNTYDFVHNAYTTQRLATIGNPVDYLRLIDRLISLKGALGSQINIPGNGMPMLRWTQ